MIAVSPSELRQEVDIALTHLPEHPTFDDLEDAIFRARLGVVAVEVGVNNGLPVEEHWGTPANPGFAVTGIDTAA